MLEEGTVNERVITACEQCIQMWAERSERDGHQYETPCETCRVTLMDENAEPAKIYGMIRGQVRTVGDHVIDVDHVAVWEAIDRYKVKEPVRCFELVNKVFHHVLSKERENAGS